MQNILGIIPARWASSRFPGKPLALINNKPMVWWVYRASKQVLEHVVVATDDARIMEAVKAFGGEAVLTSSDHPNGSTRCLEAHKIYSEQMGLSFTDGIINIQGDEPMLEPELLQRLVEILKEDEVNVGTLVSRVEDARDLENESEAFVCLDHAHNALYFSRSVIPFVRGVSRAEWLDHHVFYKHLGLYAWRPTALTAFCGLPISSLEKAESLEQNRWLEAGFKVRCAVAKSRSIPVDTPADLQLVRQKMEGHSPEWL